MKLPSIAAPYLSWFLVGAAWAAGVWGMLIFRSLDRAELAAQARSLRQEIDSLANEVTKWRGIRYDEAADTVRRRYVPSPAGGAH